VSDRFQAGPVLSAPTTQFSKRWRLEHLDFAGRKLTVDPGAFSPACSDHDLKYRSIHIAFGQPLALPDK
jgi:hypothetical protein